MRERTICDHLAVFHSAAFPETKTFIVVNPLLIDVPNGRIAAIHRKKSRQLRLPRFSRHSGAWLLVD